MEPKKNPEADINRKKILFFFAGLTVALAVVLAALEYKIFERTMVELGSLEIQLEEEEMIPITQRQPPPPPPPPQTEVLEIVEDDEEIEEELEIEDTEIDEDVEIEFIDDVGDEEVIGEEPEIFQVVEDQPEFPGGDKALFNYLSKSIKYPPMAKDAGVQGIVYVTFVVEPDGNITNVSVLRGIGAGCDDEAVRVVKAMPKWKPGKQRGKSVRVQFNLPIRFTLR